MAGITVLFFTCSQAWAFSEEDMMEGMSLSVEVNQTSDKSYKYDSANAKDSMTEFDFFPYTKTVEKHYVGDSSIPSGEHIMAEGICLTHYAQELASK